MTSRRYQNFLRFIRNPPLVLNRCVSYYLFHLLLDIYTEIVDIYQTIIIDLLININFENIVPVTKRYVKFYYGLMTFVHDTATLTLIVFMLQIIQKERTKS